MAFQEQAGPDAVRWRSLQLPAGTRQVAVRVFTPEAGPGGWLVWAHGGSWRAGSVEGWHGATAELARISGCTVVSVEYRLTPAHRHPDALADVLTALDWAFVQAAAEAGPAAVAVGGDSAGGTLAAVAALACRDRALPLAAQVLAYPPLDPSCTAASYTRYQGNFPSPQAMAPPGGTTGPPAARWCPTARARTARRSRPPT